MKGKVGEQGSQQIFKQEVITDKVGGSSAKRDVSKQSKEKRLKHKVSGYKSQSKRRSIAGCRLLLRTLGEQWNKIFMEIFRSMLHGFLPLSPMCLTELSSFWYCLKDFFTLHMLSLTIKNDDVTSGRRGLDLPGGHGWLRGSWVKQILNKSAKYVCASRLRDILCLDNIKF